MMFAVASVKRAETAFPGLHGAVEVVTRGRHVEQLSGREHLAVPGDARPMARILRLPRLHGPGVDHRRGLAGEREHEARQPAFHVLALDLDLLMAIASRVRDKGTDEVAFTFEELKRLAENERKQAEKQAEPDMEETWDLSDPADPLNIGMGWGTGGHGLGL